MCGSSSSKSSTTSTTKQQDVLAMDQAVVFGAESKSNIPIGAQSPVVDLGYGGINKELTYNYTDYLSPETVDFFKGIVDMAKYSLEGAGQTVERATDVIASYTQPEGSLLKYIPAMMFGTLAVLAYLVFKRK